LYERELRQSKIEDRLRAEKRTEFRREMDKKCRLWREDIFPNWETLKTQSEKCGSSFIWGILVKNVLEGHLLGGIPPNARGEAWRRLINISGVDMQLCMLAYVCEILTVSNCYRCNCPRKISS
jgi:hypothetical protein